MKLIIMPLLQAVKRLQEEQPDACFHIILGTDMKAHLDKWHKIEALRKLVNFYFIPRQGYEDSEYPEVSSTEVREAVANQKNLSSLVGENVSNYIKSNNLYL